MIECYVADGPMAGRTTNVPDFKPFQALPISGFKSYRPSRENHEAATYRIHKFAKRRTFRVLGVPIWWQFTSGEIREKENVRLLCRWIKCELHEFCHVASVGPIGDGFRAPPTAKRTREATPLLKDGFTLASDFAWQPELCDDECNWYLRQER